MCCNVIMMHDDDEDDDYYLKLNSCYVKLRSVVRFVEFIIKTNSVKCNSFQFLFHLIAKFESREI